MGLGAYFREKKVSWVAKGNRQYSRTMKFMGMSQENYSIVMTSFLLIGFALGLSVLFFHPFVISHPLLFAGMMMGVLAGSILSVNLVIERSMKKAGV